MGSAIIVLFSLVGCEYFVDPSGSAPVIAADSQPAIGDTTITIVVSGGLFNTSAAIGDFTVGGAYTGTVSVGTGAALIMAGATTALVSAGTTGITTAPVTFKSLASTGASAGDITITGGEIKAATTLQSAS